MKILIPPSEGKTTLEDGPLFSSTHFPHAKEVNEILERIKKFDGDYSELFDIKEDRVKEVLQNHLSLWSQHTTAAMQRYRGVVYKNIAYPLLKNKPYANEHIRIVSGMFGLITLTTLIPNYRLKMSKLDVADLWKPVITKELAKEDFVIDCLPEIHRTAYEHPHIICVDFFQSDGRNAGHHAKAVKGKFIRWLVENKVQSAKQFSSFSEDGYRWDGKMFICARVS